MLSDDVLAAFPGAILNVHPSLLPAFGGGMHAVEDALAAGVKVTGCTVHLLAAGAVDAGPIVLQAAVPVHDDDDADTLRARIHEQEWLLLPHAVALWSTGRLDIDASRVRILAQPRQREGVRLMRALLGVADRTGLVDFARGLRECGVELIATDGTRRALAEAGIEATAVSDVTGFPEMLDGRVKTLHPAIHAGILARRDLPEHMAKLAEHGFAAIDIVVISLYPFVETVARGADEATTIENIDIGGPTMIRAAAKNSASVAVVISPVAVRRGARRAARRRHLAAHARPPRRPRLRAHRRVRHRGRRVHGRARHRVRACCRPSTRRVDGSSPSCATARTRTRSARCTRSPARPGAWPTPASCRAPR